MNGDLPLLKQLRNLDWPVSLGLTVAALGLYIATLAPTVLEADAGEFQFVAWLPGIAHPSGYPLYTLIGWLWTHLFSIGDVAWRMNLLSAVFAAVAIGLTYALAGQLLDLTLPQVPAQGRKITAVVATTTFAVSHTFWSQAIIAEVYTLHALFVVGILSLALKQHLNPTIWSGRLLAFIVGLGLTHHITTILLFPALIIFLWATRQTTSESSQRGKIGLWIGYGLFMAAPLLLYLYLPLSASSTPYTTLVLSETQNLTLYDNSIGGFLRHITGTVFAGALQPAAIGGERLLLAWQLLRQQVGWAGVLLSAVGLLSLWQQRQFHVLFLTVTVFVTFVAFNLIYFIGDVFVLFIPAWLIICLWLGVGTLQVVHSIAGRFVRQKMGVDEHMTFKHMRVQLEKNMYRLVVTILALLFFGLPVYLLATQFLEISQKKNTVASERWQAIFQEPIPESALLISNDRNEIMPLWYYQFAENYRPDLIGLFPLIVPEPAYANIGLVLNQALVSGRPVYFIKKMNELNIKANIKPAGSLFRVTPYNNRSPTYSYPVSLPAITVASSAGALLAEAIDILGYDVGPEYIKPGDEITLTLHWETTQSLSIDYTSYVHLMAGDGQMITQSDHQPGGVFYPSSYWQIGEVLRDHHTLSIPVDTPPGLYELRIGMYYQPEPGVIRGMGDGVTIGQLNVMGEAGETRLIDQGDEG